jgi:hypothetical protein
MMRKWVVWVVISVCKRLEYLRKAQIVFFCWEYWYYEVAIVSDGYT